MHHPYADLIGLTVDEVEDGYSRCSIEAEEKLFNPHRVIHGAVLYALADTGMGAALYPGLMENEICATIEIKINYYHSIKFGKIHCISRVVNRGKSVANLESDIYIGEKLVAKANGNYSIFRPDKEKMHEIRSEA